MDKYIIYMIKYILIEKWCPDIHVYFIASPVSYIYIHISPSEQIVIELHPSQKNVSSHFRLRTLLRTQLFPMQVDLMGFPST